MDPVNIYKEAGDLADQEIKQLEQLMNQNFATMDSLKKLQLKQEATRRFAAKMLAFQDKLKQLRDLYKLLNQTTKANIQYDAHNQMVLKQQQEIAKLIQDLEEAQVFWTKIHNAYIVALTTNMKGDQAPDFGFGPPKRGYTPLPPRQPGPIYTKPISLPPGYYLNHPDPRRR